MNRLCLKIIFKTIKLGRNKGVKIYICNNWYYHIFYMCIWNFNVSFYRDSFFGWLDEYDYVFFNFINSGFVNCGIF